MNTQYLDRAVEIALQVDPHKVSPNPRVGCVIVHDGEIVSEGVHSFFGGPHAEVNAIRNLPEGVDTKACDVYVTLEPCGNHPQKKTPSCAHMLVEAHPKAVYVGMLDPKWNGAGLDLLRSHGIDARYVSHENSQKVNPFFLHWSTYKKPYVTLKLALSLDGRISNPNSSWVSGAVSRKRVHEMRAEHSAVLTTPKTVEIDDPQLTTRLNSFVREYSDPIVVVAGHSKISDKARLYKADREVLIYKDNNVEGLMDACASHGIDSIFTECGAAMCSALLREKVVDEILLFYPGAIYGSGVPAFTEEIDLSGFALSDIQHLGNDMCLRYKNVL